MKPSLQIQIVAAIACILVCQVCRAEPDFYEHFSSLIDTNRFGPPLTNSTLSLAKLKQDGEIAGVKLGTSMSAAVQSWGKPRVFFSSCGGGPLLAFGHGYLGFRGDKVVRISISPNSVPGLRFESGLTAMNSPVEFAKYLKLPTPASDQRELSLRTETAILTLRWQHFAVGGLQLGTLSLEPLEPTESEKP